MAEKEKSKLAIALLGGGSEMNGDEEESESGYSEACEDVIQAVKDNDPKMLQEALRAAVNVILSED